MPLPTGQSSTNGQAIRPGQIHARPITANKDFEGRLLNNTVPQDMPFFIQSDPLESSINSISSINDSNVMLARIKAKERKKKHKTLKLKRQEAKNKKRKSKNRKSNSKDSQRSNRSNSKELDHATKAMIELRGKHIFILFVICFFLIFD